jgi:hypothetical protein
MEPQKEARDGMEALTEAPTLEGPGVIEGARELLDSFDPPSASWPSNDTQLAEIDAAVEKEHGPRTIPELEIPRLATWDEVRARVAAESTAEKPAAANG